LARLVGRAGVEEVPVPETMDAARPTVSVVQRYLADLGRGDTSSAAARFGDDLTYVAPGRNRLAGVTHGGDAAGRWFAAMGKLSAGTYGIVRPIDWLASDSQALLLAREQATVDGRHHEWTRAIVFTLSGDLMTRVQLFEDDQYAYDTWLDGRPAVAGPSAAGPAAVEPAAAPPQMSGDLDDPRVRAVLSYQRQVAAGDLQHARAVFWPDVTYTVPGRSRLAGTYRGPDEVMGYLGALVGLTDNTYVISRMHWTTSPDRVGLLTRNHATRGHRSLSWDELLVFTFVDGRKKEIAHFSGDQYGVDDLFA
jgi:hypothetical protein